MKMMKSGCLMVCVVLVTLIVVFFVIINAEPMHSEMNWHLQGLVVDKLTNAIVGAVVRVSGHGKVTALNKIFSTDPRQIDVTTETDPSGRFDVNVRASVFRLDVEKSGYGETRRIFSVRNNPGKATNVNVTIVLPSAQQ
jgi:hypothetical protein